MKYQSESSVTDQNITMHKQCKNAEADQMILHTSYNAQWLRYFFHSFVKGQTKIGEMC
jgi:hypothetical protein